MTQIIDFSSYAGRKSTFAAPPAAGAEILFFMGVRYERMPEPPPVALKPAKRAASPTRTRRKRPA